MSEYDSNSLNQNTKADHTGYNPDSTYSELSGMRYNSNTYQGTSQGYGASNNQPSGHSPGMGQGSGMNHNMGQSSGMNQSMGQNPGQRYNQGAGQMPGQNPGQRAGYSSPYNHTRQTVKSGGPSGKNKSKGGGKILKTLALAAAFGLVAGITFQGVNIGTEKLRGISGKSESSKVEETTETTSDASEETSKDSSVSTQPVVQSSGSTTLMSDVSKIVETAQPSIVSITTTSTRSYQYFFQSYETPVSGAGSGIIIGQKNDKLYVATNYHVIEDADEINVGFNDGEIVSASVKGYDPDQDIAVLEVNKSDMKSSTKDSITVATVGDSDKLKVGEPSIAIGNALGYGQSVTVGYISALDRSIEGTDGSFIQTDAAINPGNSGGALIDSEGKVIGINSVKYVDSQVEGMGFSIPINTAMAIINDIIEGTQKGNVYLGISGADISKEYAQIYGFPMGIYLKEITPGSPAEKAGLHTGDIIVAFDGEEVYTVEELQKQLKQCEAGQEVSLEIYRADSMGDYDKTEVQVTLELGD